MAVRNTKTSQMRAQQRRTQKLESQAPTGFSSVTRGQFRVASPEGLKVEGSQRVTGQLYIDGYELVAGQLEVSGSFVVSGNADVTGPMAVRGPLTVRGDTTFVGPLRIEGSAAIVGPLRIEGRVDVSGPLVMSGAMTVTGRLDVQGDVAFTGRTLLNGDTDVNGRLTINGATSIKGDTSLDGDLAVRGDGRIRVGRLVLNPTGGSYGIGSLDIDTALDVNAPQVNFQKAVAVLGALSVRGPAYLPGLRTVAGREANLRVDPVTGEVYITG